MRGDLTASTPEPEVAGEGDGEGGRSRSPADETRARIVDAAERMFAEHGIEAASLRAICLAAGQSNSVAVQYHFGDRTGLINAIFSKRTPVIEKRRRALLVETQKAGKPLDIRTLVKILVWPITELKEPDGRYVYAQFMLQFLNARLLLPETSHPLGRQRMGLPQTQSSTTFEAVQMIVDQLPEIPEKVVRERLLLQLHAFLSALVNWARYHDREKGVWPLHVLIADQIDIFSTVLSMPVSPVVADHFRE